MIYFMENCAHAIRTLPALQHDELRPEDVDTEAEDHAPDEIRYACMSRPYLPSTLPKADPIFRGIQIGGSNPHAPTVDEIWKDHARARRDYG